MRNFELEDIRTQIANAMALRSDHCKYLAFLREQASIARELGVAKNTIEAQTFSTQIVCSQMCRLTRRFIWEAMKPLKRKLIWLARAMINARLLPNFLICKENWGRLSKMKRWSAPNYYLQRPHHEWKHFSAVTVDVNATEFVSQSKQTLLLALAVIFGGFVGVIYVLIASSIRGKTKIPTRD